MKQHLFVDASRLGVPDLLSVAQSGHGRATLLPASETHGFPSILA